MEVGQVSYHDKTKVKRMRVEKDNAIVNNLNRTKEVHDDMNCISPLFAIMMYARGHFRSSIQLLKFFCMSPSY